MATNAEHRADAERLVTEALARHNLFAERLAEGAVNAPTAATSLGQLQLLATLAQAHATLALGTEPTP